MCASTMPTADEREPAPRDVGVAVDREQAGDRGRDQRHRQHAGAGQVQPLRHRVEAARRRVGGGEDVLPVVQQAVRLVVIVRVRDHVLHSVGRSSLRGPTLGGDSSTSVRSRRNGDAQRRGRHGYRRPAESSHAYRPHLDGLPRGRGVPGGAVPRRQSPASRAATSASTCSSCCRASSSPSCCCATSSAAGRSDSAASTRAGSGACCPPRSSRCIVTARRVHRDRVARRGRGRRRVVQGRVPVLDELVLHPPVDRLLRRRHRDEPGAALLVARGRGAVLPAVAAALGGLFLLDPPPRSARADAARSASSSPSARWRRRSWALSLRTSNPNRAYYGTDARAYELLAGALLALVPALVASAARHPTGDPRRDARSSVAALVLIASSCVRSRRDRTRHRGHDHDRACSSSRSRPPTAASSSALLSTRIASSTSARSPTAPTSGTGS